MRPRASSSELEREEMVDEERLRRGWIMAAGGASLGFSSLPLVLVGAAAEDLPAIATSRSESPVPLRLTLVLLAAANVAPPTKPFS